jgi:hypothetical protein
MRCKASFNSSSRHQVCRDSGIKRCLAPLSFEFTEFRNLPSFHIIEAAMQHDKMIQLTIHGEHIQYHQNAEYRKRDSVYIFPLNNINDVKFDSHIILNLNSASNYQENKLLSII